jgi:hypothetical protein
MIVMATFGDVEKYLAQREALNQTMLELRTQLAMVRNAAAETDTWLRANSALVKGWRIRSREITKGAAP